MTEMIPTVLLFAILVACTRVASKLVISREQLGAGELCETGVDGTLQGGSLVTVAGRRQRQGRHGLWTGNSSFSK